jgi:hypothetical protein
MRTVKTKCAIYFYGYEPFFNKLKLTAYITKNSENELTVSYIHGYFPPHKYGEYVKTYFNKNKHTLQKELEIKTENKLSEFNYYLTFEPEIV